MVTETETVRPTPCEAVARDWWRRLSDLNFNGAGELLGPDVVVEWPLTGERFNGRETIVALNANYPGQWRCEVLRCIADGDSCVTETRVSDGRESHTAISFFTVRDGLIRELREYWPAPYEAPEWRRQQATSD